LVATISAGSTIVADHQQEPYDPVTLLSREEKRNHCIVDRRSGFDRRRAYSLAYFADGGLERRCGKDRRRNPDRRQLWEMRGTPCTIAAE
jgi:hypothetical protein